MSIITPATLPASAQLLLAIGPQGENGGSPDTQSPFSALLDAEIGAGLLGLASEKSLAPATGKAPGDIPARQTGKLPGKPTGKTLPELPQFAALTVPTKGEDMLPLDEAIVPVAADGRIDVPSAADAVPAVLPTLIANAAPPVTITSTEGANRPAPPHSAAPEAQPLALPALGQKLLARITQTLSPIAPADPALANVQEIRIEPTPAPAPALQTFRPAPVARSILAALGLTRSAKPAPMAPAEVEPVSAATAPMAASPLPLPVEAAPGGLVAALRQLPKQPSDDFREAAPIAARPTANLSDHAAAPQTMPAVLELAPLLSLDQGTSPAAAPAIIAPAATPAPHDFAALVDRLIEARQTAQASLAVQTVIAAVTHAEFGQVSLQFRQDADGLSVVMAGADPDLARAVQIAAPLAQTGSNDNHAAQRQDSTGQAQAQAHAQAQAQAQANNQQQRGQSPQHRADDLHASANPSPRQRSQQDSPARGGIFA